MGGIKRMNATTACVLVLLALFAMLLLARGESDPFANFGPGPLLPRPYPFPYPNGHRRWPCGPNEVFKRCASSSCGERKCYQVGLPGPRPCTLDCVYGCFCKPRFYRNRRGRCVRKEQCRRQRPFPVPLPRPYPARGPK
uniref:Putative tick til 11 n=1 Tax=Amblyomma parvum TaxID=251391 RepID=A0A023FXJ0_AMBPA